MEIAPRKPGITQAMTTNFFKKFPEYHI